MELFHLASMLIALSMKPFSVWPGKGSQLSWPLQFSPGALRVNALRSGQFLSGDDG